MATRVVFDPEWREIALDLAEPALDRGARIVLDGMQREIPRSQDGSYGRPPGYAASQLRVLRGGRIIGGQRYRDVGTDATTPDGTSYPSILHHGSKPHVIEPKRPGYALRNKATGQVFGYRVNHPGTKANPWATRAAMRLHGRRL